MTNMRKMSSIAKTATRVMQRKGEGGNSWVRSLPAINVRRAANIEEVFGSSVQAAARLIWKHHDRSGWTLSSHNGQCRSNCVPQAPNSFIGMSLFSTAVPRSGSFLPFEKFSVTNNDKPFGI